MKQHALRMPDELFAQVEDARGDVPRNTWIVRALESALQTTEKTDTDIRDAGLAYRIEEKMARKSAIEVADRTSANAKQGVRPRPKAGKR